MIDQSYSHQNNLPISETIITSTHLEDDASKDARDE